MIFLIKLLIFLKRLLTAFFVKAVVWPSRFILRFLFYQLLLKLYLLYLSTVKRLGFTELGKKSFAFLVNQKLAHLLVAALTIFFVIFNYTGKIMAVSPDALAGKTFLAEIISSEFGDNDQLVEEYFDEQAAI